MDIFWRQPSDLSRIKCQGRLNIRKYGLNFPARRNADKQAFFKFILQGQDGQYSGQQLLSSPGGYAALP